MASAPTNYRNMGRGGRGGSPYGQRSGSASPHQQRGSSPNHLQQPRGGPSSTPNPRTLHSRPSDLDLKLAASRRQSSAGSNLVPSPRAYKRGGGSSMAAGGGTASRTTSMNHGGLSMFDSPSHRADGRSQAESGGALTPTTSVKVGVSTPYSTPGTTRLNQSNTSSSLGPARRDKRETTKCGWLEKFAVGRGMMGFKNWQRRYFTVNNNGLNYSKGEKASGAARTYIPFTNQKSPEVKLAPVFLLHSISPNLHPEAHDAGNKYCYFGIRFEENKKSFLLLLRTVDSSTRERWVRFLAQMLPWGVQYNLGVPPSHPQDPTLQRLYDPEDLDDKERKALRKTVLEWDEGYQEFRYRKIVLKALASAAACTTTTSMRSVGGGGGDSVVSRLASMSDSPNSRTSGSPKISRAVSMSSGGNHDSRANSNLSNPLMSSVSGGGPLPHLGSGKSIGSAFQLGGDVTDPDSPYFTGITYIGGVSSLSAPTTNGSMPSAPNSSSYLARCFGFGGPQQGWEMQDGDKEDDDDDDAVEEVDYTAYGPTGERLVDDDAVPSDDNDGGGLARLGSHGDPLPGGASGAGGADSLGTSGEGGNVDDLPSATTNLRTASSSRGASHQEGNGQSSPVTPIDNSNPAFPTASSAQQHHNPQRRVSSHNVQQQHHHLVHHHYVGGSTPRKSGGLETANDSTTSTTMDYDENSRHFRSDAGVNSPMHVDIESPEALARRTPTSASTSRPQYDSRSRGMTAVVRPSGAYERQQGIEYGSSQQPSRNRADSSILIDNSSSTTRNTSFMRDPRRRPTLGPEL